MMGTEKPLLSQKEYLKRYLNKDKNKKKKNKPKISSSSHVKRSVIIDDDLGLKDVANVDDVEFNLDYLGDEAPQIAGIVDERPAELKAKEKYSNNLWRSFGEGNQGNFPEQLENVSETTRTKGSENRSVNSESDSDLSLPRPGRNEARYEKAKEFSRNRNENSYNFPKEKNKDGQKGDLHQSPKRKQSQNRGSSDSDQSPKRKRSQSRRNRDLDRSPKQKRNQNRQSSDSDQSLKRKRCQNRRGSDSDQSPKRKRSQKNYDSDISPPRISRSGKNMAQLKREEYEFKNKIRDRSHKDSGYIKGDKHMDKYKVKSKQRNNGESDSDSPAKESNRRSGEVQKRNDREYQKKHEDERSHYNLTKHSSSFDRESKEGSSRHIVDKFKKHGETSSYSHSSKKYDEPELPKEFHRKSETSGKVRSGRKNSSDSDRSPDRNHSPFRKNKDKSSSSSQREEKMVDGKKSGLQDAKNLKEELKKLKDAEDKLFKKMDPTQLGATAAPIKRDRKTGQIRQIEIEKKEEKVNVEKKAKNEEKYYRWGKGLKQMQDKEDRIADAIHEMSKPLARYRDDKDLDAFLRAQEREGDPMLDYIKNKQAESHNVIDLTVGIKKKRYNASFMPNRFGIEPGYRWDGVDRSNGYEKRWFEQKNARKAIEEEAFKWSTSDM